MAKYSKPELETQAKDLLNQILVELSKVGIQANLNEISDGIKIPEYHYDIVQVGEKRSSVGLGYRSTGVLEVDFRSIHMGRGCLCNAKRFKIDAKDLMTKIVNSIKERQDALVALKKRENTEERAQRAHQKVLKTLMSDYPDFSGNIEYHKSCINLTFGNLSEDKAQLILKTLRDAGVQGESRDLSNEGS